MGNFEDDKWLTLERLQNRRSRPEHDYDVLERCDDVVLSTIQHFLKQHPVRLSREARGFREVLQEALDVKDHVCEDRDSLPYYIDLCIELLERLEDVDLAWMSVALFERKRLHQLYDQLEVLRQDDSELYSTMALRSVVGQLLRCSPLLKGAERVRFRLNLENSSDMELLRFLNRFLSAQFEFGEALQKDYLSSHPELKGVVRRALRKL